MICRSVKGFRKTAEALLLLSRVAGSSSLDFFSSRVIMTKVEV